MIRKDLLDISECLLPSKYEKIFEKDDELFCSDIATTVGEFVKANASLKYLYVGINNSL